MQNPGDSFQELHERLRNGNDSAAEEVVDDYANRLKALARKRLPPQLAGKISASDVLQSALNTFFQRYKEGRFDSLGGRVEIWRLLADIVSKKCNRQISYYFAKCRDPGREENLEPPSDSSGLGWQAESTEAAPSEGVVLDEVEERVLERCLPRDRPIIKLIFEGLSETEIAEKTGRTVGAVERVRSRLRKLLKELRDEQL